MILLPQLSDAICNKSLTGGGVLEDDPATAKTAAGGSENPERKGGHRHQSGFFTSAAWLPVYGQAMREPLWVAGFLFAGFSARMVPPSLPENRGGGVDTLKRSIPKC